MHEVLTSARSDSICCPRTLHNGNWRDEWTWRSSCMHRCLGDLRWDFRWASDMLSVCWTLWGHIFPAAYWCWQVTDTCTWLSSAAYCMVMGLLRNTPSYKTLMRKRGSILLTLIYPSCLIKLPLVSCFIKDKIFKWFCYIHPHKNRQLFSRILLY